MEREMFVLNRPLDYSALPEYYSAALYAFAADNVRPPPMQHQSRLRTEPSQP